MHLGVGFRRWVLVLPEYSSRDTVEKGTLQVSRGVPAALRYKKSVGLSVLKSAPFFLEDASKDVTDRTLVDVAGEGPGWSHNALDLCQVPSM